MKYLLAFLACVGVWIVYFIIAMLLGWKYGGGVIPMLILFAIFGATWRGVTKSYDTRKALKDERDTDDSNHQMSNYRVAIISLIGAIIGLFFGAALARNEDEILLSVRIFFGAIALGLLFYALYCYSSQSKIGSSQNFTYYLFVSKFTAVVAIILLLICVFAEVIIDELIEDIFSIYSRDSFGLYLGNVLMLSFTLLVLSFDLFKIRMQNNA